MRITRMPVLIVAILAFWVVFCVYMLWPSYNYQPDSIQAAMAIDIATLGTQYYHPAGGVDFEPGLTEKTAGAPDQTINSRYLLDYPTSVLTYRIWRAAGWDDLVVTPLVVLRGLVGGLGVLFFVLAMYELTGNRLVAFIAALGLGVCASYWTFSTDMYQTINSAALVAVSLYVLARQSNANREGLRLDAKFVLALILAVSTLYNILAVFTAFAFCIGVALIHARGTLTDRIKHFLIFGFMYALITALMLIVVFLILSPQDGLASPLVWSDGKGTSIEVVDFSPLPDLLRAFLGFTKAHMIFPGVNVRNFGGFRAFWESTDTIHKAILMVFYGGVGFVAAVPAAVLYWRRKALPANRRWLLIMLPVWFLAYAAFNWFWLPSDVHYWIVPMMIWWTATCMCLVVIRADRPGAYRTALGLVGAFVVLTFGLNLFSQFLPESKPENNPWVAASMMLRESDPDALFISDGHPLDFLIAYFTHRDIVATNIVALATNDDAAHIEAIVDGKYDQHRAGGTEVFIYSDDNIDALANLIGVSSDELEAAWEFPDLTIYRVMYPAS